MSGETRKAGATRPFVFVRAALFLTVLPVLGLIGRCEFDWISLEGVIVTDTSKSDSVDSPNGGKNSSKNNNKSPSNRGARHDGAKQAAVTAAKLRWMVGFVVFVFVLAGLWWALKRKYDANTTPESYGYVSKFEKDGIPPIEAFDLNGKPFDLSKVTTPIVIVNFWASWCGPCVEEFPSMLKLVEALDGKVTIVAVSMDEDEKDLRAFTKLFKVPRKGFEVLWDKEKKVMETYAVGKLPESYIVGSDRKLIRKVLGIEDWASANAISYFESLAEGAHAQK